MSVYVVAKTKDGQVAYKGWYEAVKSEKELEVRAWVPSQEFKIGKAKCYSLSPKQKKEIEEYTK